MSAIAGLRVADGRTVPTGLIERMSQSLAHRGSDRVGFHVEGCVALAHRALFSTPESHTEQQPLTRGSRTITGDLRVDNRAELFAALSIPPDQGTAIGDAELVLRAHEKWGEACLDHIAGDFAFAIFDAKTGVLFCARDAFAIRPFFYATHGETFAFASEMRALLLLPEVSADIDELKVAEFLSGSVDDGERTFRRDIRRLRGGHYLVHSRGSTRIQRWWNLDPSRKLQLDSDEEYRLAFRDKFAECVGSRLRSTYPVGSTLSGGLDSSSIASTARWLRGPSPGSPLHTFSAVFPGLPDDVMRIVDERKYARAVSSLPGIEGHEVSMVDTGFLTDIERLMWHQEEPFFGPNVYIHWALYKAAHQAGVRVFLDGHDGDTIISYGYERLPHLALTLQWRTLWRESKAVADRIGHRSISAKKVLRYYGLRPLVPESVREWRARKHGGEASGWGRYNLLRPDFAARTGVDERLREIARAEPHPLLGREGHWFDIRSPLLQYAGEIADKAAAAFSLECRYPFLDRRLAAFCLSLPFDQRLRNGWTRYIMRTGLEGILPASIVSRADKSNLGVNHRFIKQEDRERLASVIDLARAHLRPYIDIETLETGFAEYLKNPSESYSVLLHGATSLALWFESLDKVSSPAPSPATAEFS